MFTLYQNQRLTKQMIEDNRLYQCNLAFWLCVKQDDKFVRVSPESLSSTITESEFQILFYMCASPSFFFKKEEKKEKIHLSLCQQSKQTTLP